MNAPLDLARRLELFAVEGEFIGGGRLGSGHIHETYEVGARGPGGVRRYCLQRFNEEVFADLAKVMENIRRVTEHLRTRVEARGGDPDRETLTLVPARDGAAYARDEEGVAWRAFLLVEDARTVDVPKAAGEAYHAARAFGRFVADLADLPGPRLHETIPGFHDTPRRLARLAAAVEGDAAGRAGEVRPEVEFALARTPAASRITGALASGELPERVIHNDTKINNVLLDAASGEGVCVIDLDTVMPGSFLYDFGDAVRAGAARCAEDAAEADRAGVDLDRFRALARGYLEALAGVLTPLEVAWMPHACELLALECGARFLTDHLEGDRYFRVTRPGQNLARARTQFAMVADLERRRDELAAAVADADPAA